MTKPKSTDAIFPEGDNEFEEDTITEVRKDADGDWSITRKTGGSLYVAHAGVDNPQSVEPHVGDRARFYGGFGSPVRGLFLNGKCVYYRTPVEQQVRHEEWNKKRLADERARWEAEKPTRDAQLAAMPEVFRQRIEGFHARRPTTFWEHERYEVFCCVEAQKIIAEAQRQSPDPKVQWEWIRDFHKAPYDDQKKKLPDMSDDHSGNTFGTACMLASCYVQDPELISQAHGALCPLLGCKEYGCYASTPEAKAARAAREAEAQRTQA